MRVVYVFYNVCGDQPAIFDDPDYPTIAKEWLTSVHV